MDTDRLPDFSAENDNHSAQVIQIDAGKHVNTIVILAVMSTVAAMFSAWGAYQSNLAFTEARMVQYYLQDPSYRTQAELAEWARYKHDKEK